MEGSKNAKGLQPLYNPTILQVQAVRRKVWGPTRVLKLAAQNPYGGRGQLLLPFSKVHLPQGEVWIPSLLLAFPLPHLDRWSEKAEGRVHERGAMLAVRLSSAFRNSAEEFEAVPPTVH